MQFANYTLTKCQLSRVLNITPIDEAALLLAAVCHDLGHDGFTNGYHTNAVTIRSLNSNDNAVQESYHASEMFKLMTEADCNITKNLSREEFKIFRKRAVGMILATDMARHKADLTLLE